MVLAVSIALGFATFENANYILSPESRLEEMFIVALSRGALSVPLHAVTGALVGWGVALRHRAGPANPLGPPTLDANPAPSLFVVCGLPWFLHGLFDFALMVGPAAEPHLSKAGVETFTKAGIAAAASIVAISFALCVWLVGSLRTKSLKERPREEAAAWPSIEAFEQGMGCVGGRGYDGGDYHHGKKGVEYGDDDGGDNSPVWR